MSRRVFLLLLGLAAPCRAQPVPPSNLPGVAPGSVRVLVNGDVSPWRGVVRVQTEVGGRCSGVLVGLRTVLTAAHCLFGRGTGRLVRPQSVHVLTGYSRGAYAGHARATATEIGPGFAMPAEGAAPLSSRGDADWAIVTLDAPLGTPDRVLPLVREVPPPGTAAMLGGFEQDRAQVLLADVACMVTGPVHDRDGHVLVAHSCAGTRGVSGAPLLVRVPGGGWGVAGIATTAAVGIAGGFAVPVSALPQSPEMPR